LSPKKYLSFLMGVWFLSSFYGHFFAGKIANLTTVIDGQESIFTQGVFSSFTPYITSLNYTSISEQSEGLKQLYAYVSVFTGIGIITLLIGVLALFLSPKIKKMMGGVK